MKNIIQMLCIETYYMLYFSTMLYKKYSVVGLAWFYIVQLFLVKHNEFKLHNSVVMILRENIFQK